MEIDSVLPDSIKIGPFDYKIAEVSDLRDEESELLGHIDHRKLRIEIEKDMPVVRKYAVMWHETLHGILEQAGYESQDEQLIVVLSYGITQALFDNEWMREVPA